MFCLFFVPRQEQAITPAILCSVGCAAAKYLPGYRFNDQTSCFSLILQSTQCLLYTLECMWPFFYFHGVCAWLVLNSLNFNGDKCRRFGMKLFSVKRGNFSKWIQLQFPYRRGPVTPSVI